MTNATFDPQKNQTWGENYPGFFGWPDLTFNRTRNYFYNSAQRNVFSNKTAPQTGFALPNLFVHHHHYYPQIANGTNGTDFNLYDPANASQNWQRNSRFSRRGNLFHIFVNNFKNRSVSSDLINRLENLKPLFKTHSTVLDMKEWHETLANYIQQFERVMTNLAEVPKKMKKLLLSDRLFKTFAKQFENDLPQNHFQNGTLPNALENILIKLKAATNKFPVIDKTKIEEVERTIQDLFAGHNRLNETSIQQESRIKALAAQLDLVSDFYKQMSNMFFQTNSTFANETNANFTFQGNLSEEVIAKHLDQLEEIHKSFDQNEFEQLKSNRKEILTIKISQENRARGVISIENGLEESQAARKEIAQNVVDFIDDENLMSGNDFKLRQVKNLAKVLANSY